MNVKIALSILFLLLTGITFSILKAVEQVNISVVDLFGQLRMQENT
jgi:hypothetical protein